LVNAIITRQNIALVFLLNSLMTHDAIQHYAEIAMLVCLFLVQTEGKQIAEKR